MRTCDFDAVYFEGECYCNECLPDNMDTNEEEVSPIFAESSCSTYPVCIKCGYVHTYMDLDDIEPTLQMLREYTHRGWGNSEYLDECVESLRWCHVRTWREVLAIRRYEKKRNKERENVVPKSDAPDQHETQQ